MTHSWKKLALPAAIAVVALALAGCSGSTNGGEAAEAPTGGTLTYAYATDTTTLDPIGIRDASNSLDNGSRAFAIYDALFALAPDNGDLIPRIADSITASDDGTTQTLTLKPGVLFSDGTPLDAEAVKFNWERLQDPANSALAAAYANRASDIQVVDDVTLTFTSTPATTQFGKLIARYFPFIGSPTAIKSEGADFGIKPVGAGPFVVENWVQGSEIDLVANPDYYAGAPKLDKLVMRFVPDPQQRVQGMQTGEIQLIDGNAQLFAQADPSYEQYTWQSQAGSWMGMNANKAPFDNPDAVAAMKTAVDTEAYAAQFLSESADSYFSHSSPYFDESGVFPAYDPKATQKLLDKYAAETGGPLTFDIMTPSSYSSTAEGLQAMLSVYDNIKVGIRPMDGSTNLTAQLSGDWQAAVFGAIFADPYPEMNEQLVTGAGRNFTNVSDPALDKVLKDAELSTSTDDRKADYIEAGEIITTLPYAMLLRSTSGLMSLPSVGGLERLNDYAPDWGSITIAG